MQALYNVFDILYELNFHIKILREENSSSNLIEILNRICEENKEFYTQIPKRNVKSQYSVKLLVSYFEYMLELQSVSNTRGGNKTSIDTLKNIKKLGRDFFDNLKEVSDDDMLEDGLISIAHLIDMMSNIDLNRELTETEKQLNYLVEQSKEKTRKIVDRTNTNTKTMNDIDPYDYGEEEHPQEPPQESQAEILETIRMLYNICLPKVYKVSDKVYRVNNYPDVMRLLYKIKGYLSILAMMDSTNLTFCMGDYKEKLKKIKTPRNSSDIEFGDLECLQSLIDWARANLAMLTIDKKERNILTSFKHAVMDMYSEIQIMEANLEQKVCLRNKMIQLYSDIFGR